MTKTMTHIICLGVLFFGVAALGSTVGHSQRTHACVAPDRPEDDQNDVMWQRFLDEINRFRDCVNAEMAWHQAAAQAHQGNARAMVDLWDQFVTGSLNAPEDFPWPPEQRRN